MKKRFNITRHLTACLLATVVAAAGVSNLSAAKQPNIIIFLADDLGYGDLGCYGHPIIQTPHMDQLANEGVRLTDCHSGGTVCSPSRASLLTGRAPYRTGFYYIAGAGGCHLRASEVTLPSLLKTKGYDTCFVGKWHLGKFKAHPDPKAHGFDHWYATEVNAFDGPESPEKFVRNGEAVGEVNEWYCDSIVREAIEWMEKRPDQSKPYLLVVSFHEPHTPIAPPEKYLKMYDNKLVHDLEKGIAYGEVYRPLDRDISPNKKYYYGTVTQMDDAVGRLMKAADSEGKEDNVVILTSDNGPETPVTFQESGGQWKDPIRDMCFGTPGPWRGMKRYVYEGGHRVPGIVRWSGVVPAGSISTQLVNGTDWMPTICKTLGIEVPSDRTIDGVDIRAALNNTPVKRPIPASWTFPVHLDAKHTPGMSMRDGNYALLGWFESPEKVQNRSAWVHSAKLVSFKLYDITADRSQANPLNERRPKEFERLKKQMIELWVGIQKDAPDWRKKQP